MFVLACVAVPVLWGIVVNWLFGRLQSSVSVPESDASETDEVIEADSEEPIIEYYI